MANNKVQLANGTVLIDLTDTTAVASDVAAGKYFYTADGIKREGTATAGSVVITETEDSHGGTIVDIISTDVVRLHSKSATPTTSPQTVLPDTGYEGLSQVTVGAIPSEYIVPTGTKTISITENGTITEDVAAYASASITVDVESTPTLQSKSVTVTPSASTQSQTVSPDTGYDGLSSVSVTVNPIPSEYVIPTGTLTINQNGTVDVSQYANVTVNVPSSGGVGLVTQDAEGYVVFDDGAPSSGGPSLDNYVEADSSVFTGPIELNTAIKISGYALYGRTGMTSLRSTSVGSVRSHGCDGCTGLTTVVLEEGKYLSNDSFSGCTNLTAVDLAGEPLSFDYSGLPYTNCFNGCSALKTLVIRSSFVTKLNNINNFANSPFASGKSGGTLYVPSALIADYQAATNWSTILGYTNNSIVAIEGSIYENAYVDGSVIST